MNKIWFHGWRTGFKRPYTQWTVGFVAALAIIYGVAYFKKRETMKSNGTIIILNGPSAAGKSTLQKKIQELAPDFYIKLGIDGLFDAPLPDVDPKTFKFEPGFVYEQKDNQGQLIRKVEIIKDDNDNL